jgi:predicted metalloprotease
MKIGLPGRRSTNLEDRRGAPGMRTRGGGMPLPLPIGVGGGATGLLVLLAFVLFQVCASSGGGGFGFDAPLDTFPRAPAPGVQDAPPARTSPEEEALVDFVSAVLDDVQVFWDEQFAVAGQTYEEARLVVFREATETACGVGSAETGPFYCPPDRTAYLDLSFFEELTRRFGAPGDFAQAYVIAHELAHHVQNVTGISDEVHSRQREDTDVANELSVRLELQADCLAGVWGHSTYQRGILESGDLEEGLSAAAAIGDDRIQRQAGARVDPETWTHGSSEQRVEWFRRGFDSGEASACDTFSGDL